MEYDAVMKRIMKSDDNIRNCIVADTEGEIKASMHRDGVRNYLSERQLLRSIQFVVGIKEVAALGCIILFLLFSSSFL